MKSILKNFISKLHFKINDNNRAVFLYCSRRGGSTMLMQALSSSLKAVYIDQPFSTYSAKEIGHIKLIPPAVKSEMLYLDKDDESSLKNFINDLIVGNRRYNSSYRPFNDDHHFLYDTTILKVTNGKSYIDKIDKWFTGVNIVLLRNPFSVAMSCYKNSWGVTNHAFLNNRAFVDNCLNYEQFELCNLINENGTDKERHLVNWFLDHIYLINNLPENTIVIKYEDLIALPAEVAEKLQKVLPDLDDVKFINSLKSPSKSSKFSSNLRAVKSVSSDFIESQKVNYKNGFLEDEINLYNKLLNAFPSVKKYYT